MLDIDLLLITYIKIRSSIFDMQINQQVIPIAYKQVLPVRLPDITRFFAITRNIWHSCGSQDYRRGLVSSFGYNLRSFISVRISFLQHKITARRFGWCCSHRRFWLRLPSRKPLRAGCAWNIMPKNQESRMLGHIVYCNLQFSCQVYGHLT